MVLLGDMNQILEGVAGMANRQEGMKKIDGRMGTVEKIR